ncbi:MAG TPA: hypothetical protein DG577_10135 [Firmicutes bacterium]|nr:hypothetical protein [Bacillota bacterium]
MAAYFIGEVSLVLNLLAIGANYKSECAGGNLAGAVLQGIHLQELPLLVANSSSKGGRRI